MGRLELENGTNHLIVVTELGTEVDLEALAGGGIPETIIDAAGDLIVGSAPDTAVRLPMGTGLQVLRVNAGATDLEYATPSSGGANVGTATLDFGAFPGAYDASVAVTGQAGIVAGSVVQATIRPVTTADHSPDEHMLEPLKVFAGNIVAATGFTIYGFSTTEIFERIAGAGVEQSPSPVDAAGVGVAANYLGRVGGGRGVNPTVAWNSSSAPDTARRVPRIYGQFTIAWSWA